MCSSTIQTMPYILRKKHWWCNVWKINHFIVLIVCFKLRCTDEQISQYSDFRIFAKLPKKFSISIITVYNTVYKPGPIVMEVYYHLCNMYQMHYCVVTVLTVGQHCFNHSLLMAVGGMLFMLECCGCE